MDRDPFLHRVLPRAALAGSLALAGCAMQHGATEQVHAGSKDYTQSAMLDCANPNVVVNAPNFVGDVPQAFVFQTAKGGLLRLKIFGPGSDMFVTYRTGEVDQAMNMPSAGHDVLVPLPPDGQVIVHQVQAEPLELSLQAQCAHPQSTAPSNPAN